ncbi:hypothetical protein NDU88_005506 [Pleurodeles waltl]|uniref:Uncharacterized protein n=1 Tax=Pleurodeles waltl TaxID=8319 RepID=A0AAV7MCA8_PLEWA|nr:hypothetical protein NDU88_005506 [Pleurodeles waltl]
MWITKNGESRDIYDPEDLRVFLEGLQNHTQSMDTAAPIYPDMQGPLLSVALSTPAPEVVGRTTADFHPRGRDLERLTKSHDDKGQVLQAVAIHRQIADRYKSRSPLKPTLPPPPHLRARKRSVLKEPRHRRTRGPVRSCRGPTAGMTGRRDEYLPL